MKRYLVNFYVISLTLTTLFVVFFILLFVYSSNIVEDKQEEIMMLELNNLNLKMMETYHEIENTLHLVELYITQEPSDQELLNHLIDIDESNVIISSLYLGKPDKTMINSSGFVPGPTFDLTTRIWYQNALAAGDLIFTPVFLNATENRLIVTAAKPIYVEDELLGILATDIDVTLMSTLVSEKSIGKQGSAFLIDQQQNFIAHPDIDFNDLSIVNSTSYLDHLAFDENEMFHHEFSYNGINGIFAHVETFNGFYDLAIFIPNQEFYHNSVYFFYLFLILLVVMVSLGVFLFLVNQKHVIYPMRRLVNDIGMLNIKNNPYDKLPSDKKTGFNEVRDAINRNLEFNKNLFLEKEKTRLDLLLENQRYNLLINSTADIIFEIDKQKRFVTVVGKGLDRIGVPASNFIGKTVLESFGHEGKERDRIYDRALNGQKGYYMWTFHKDDRNYFFESSISPIYDSENHIIGAVGISRDITEQQEKQSQIEFLSVHDYLTGLYNRRYFVEKLSEYDQKAFYPLGVMMMDLNGLKILNDAYGHLFGDMALNEVTAVLKEVIGNHGNIISRIGGDEFSVVLPNTNQTIMENMKTEIYQKISEKKIENVQLSLSIGYSIKTDEYTNLERLLKLAEDDMYRKKQTEGMSVRNNAIKAILKTLTDKYQEERMHLHHVSEICDAFGKVLELNEDQVKELKLAGLYHDIGKISIPDAILNKPGKLTDEEYTIMKTHTEAGYQILRAADAYSNLADYALTHHEHWNGKGYPRGLKGKDIPYFSRIISIIDAYEAMTSDRVYRKKMSKDEAIKEIKRCSGTQFDPILADKFINEYLLKKDKI